MIESIRSALPLCDRMIVLVGNSDDETIGLIHTIGDPKIQIIESVWDDSLRQGGQVLAVETNKAMDAIDKEFDWCLYLQADEVIHENDYSAIRNAMAEHLDNKRVEGLLFKYLHFWGTFDYIGINRQWYRHEIRIIRNNKLIRSYRDAQGFRIESRKLNVKTVDAHIFHYGWVRPPAKMIAKQRKFASLYMSGDQLLKTENLLESFNYKDVDAVKRFKGTHPEVMQVLIDNLSWEVTINENRLNMRLRDRILYALEKVFNYRFFEYKNYRIVK
ncbi:MAG TPA: hypothetical protein VLH61_02080 [Bacteroidales bacterium]|nr:hypothetical protein [Bacteroidales bacterium]